jgi:hypothetical protein
MVRARRACVRAPTCTSCCAGCGVWLSEQPLVRVHALSGVCPRAMAPPNTRTPRSHPHLTRVTPVMSQTTPSGWQETGNATQETGVLTCAAAATTSRPWWMHQDWCCSVIDATSAGFWALPQPVSQPPARGETLVYCC